MGTEVDPLPPTPAIWGMSTGAQRVRAASWPDAVQRAAAESSDAIELAALAGEEWEGLVEHLRTSEPLPFRFVSVHAPTKRWLWDEGWLVRSMEALPAWVDTVVIHPDLIGDAALYERLGSRISIENMDPRKPTGRTTDELAPILRRLPHARVCFDIAHAAAVDPTLGDAEHMLARFRERLSHVHVSTLDATCHHQPLTHADARRFAAFQERLRRLPWVFEA